MHRIPNVLASLRIALAPVVVALALGDAPASLTAGLFAIAAATDFFDGYLARRWEVTTVLGAFLDSTADKLLVTGSLLALIALDRVSVWAALVIVMREFIVMALRGLTAVEGTVVPPSILGKVKAASQFVAIFLAFLRLGEPIGGLFVDEWAMWLAVVITVVSGWGYLRAFFSHLQRASSRA
ncbi:MAG: CDP-diacylglycerol--glycerol-3-phosphate 3-phosphatidyltransferase [Acidimicrobiia bacterium]|nr:CDP-diacylglycerol--glycerol-3-phosphate 3-phosphatidyltransferase [Acidimicrobiia bacterium]